MSFINLNESNYLSNANILLSIVVNGSQSTMDLDFIHSPADLSEDYHDLIIIICMVMCMVADHCDIGALHTII